MPLDDTEIKSLIEAQGKAFDAFKASHEEEIKELKKGVSDPVLQDRLTKIEKSLDGAVEAKAAIEAAIKAERKEREDLELRLARGGGEKSGDMAKEMKSFNLSLGAAGGKGQVDDKGYDAYKSAFANFLRKDARLLSGEEVKAMSVGSDPDGGYLVTPDVSGRIVKKVYETSPIRQIASVTTISSDALEGLEDNDDAGYEWQSATQTPADTTTPQLGKWRIPVEQLGAMPKITQKLLDDAAVDVEAWLADKVGAKIGRVENTAFVTGNGVGKPRGFTDYTTAADSGAGVTWGSIGYVKSGASADFAASNPADKIFDLVGLVKEAYLQNSRFVTRRSVITKIRKFKETTTNAYLWQPGLQAGAPESLLGYPITRAEDIPTLAADSLSLWFGDFMAAYQIVDRLGVRVLRDPYTVKPYVLFYTTKRVGGGVVNFEAIKAMLFNS